MYMADCYYLDLEIGYDDENKVDEFKKYNGWLEDPIQNERVHK